MRDIIKIAGITSLLVLLTSLSQATQGDINGDNVIGLPEAIYSLQVSAGIESQTNYFAKPLPDKFIAVTVFTSSSYNSAPSTRIKIVSDIAAKAKEKGLQAVNLVVDWRDVEPARSLLEFETLKNMISEQWRLIKT